MKRVERKKILFLTYSKQSGGSQALPINTTVLTVYSINYFIHRNSHNFYNASETVRKFVSAVEKNFVPGPRAKVQRSMEILNYQTPLEGSIKRESKRTWLTKVFTCVHFNRFFQNELTII